MECCSSFSSRIFDIFVGKKVLRVAFMSYLESLGAIIYEAYVYISIYIRYLPGTEQSFQSEHNPQLHYVT